MMKGSYVLLVELAESRPIRVGRLGLCVFPRGYYAYVGSALNGIKARVGYHLRENKKPRWHIDYLLQQAAIRRIVFCQSEEGIECRLAQSLSKDFPPVPGFGSSDCKCRGHLYFDVAGDRLEKGVVKCAALLTHSVWIEEGRQGPP